MSPSGPVDVFGGRSCYTEVVTGGAGRPQGNGKFIVRKEAMDIQAILDIILQILNVIEAIMRVFGITFGTA